MLFYALISCSTMDLEAELSRLLVSLDRMSLGDAVNFLLFDNPVSKTVGNLLTEQGILTPKTDMARGYGRRSMPPPASNEIFAPGRMSQLLGSSGIWTRMAGLSGGLAVVLGAYGAHAFLQKQQVSAEKKLVFETANRYHFFHSIALLGVPLCRRPMLTGSLMLAGMVIFSGTCYGYAFTNKQELRRVTPFGGVLLILAWLSMII